MASFKELYEARKAGGNYSQTFKKGELDKVILELSGSDSAKMTRLANEYKKLDAATKALNEERDALNAEVKGIIEDSFDPSDEVATRIVKTVSLTLTMTKTTKPSPKVDHEAVLNELLKMVPDLKEKVDALALAYTTIGSPRKGGIKVDVSEGAKSFTDRVKTAIKKLISSILPWAREYDKKLDKVEKMLKA